VIPSVAHDQAGRSNVMLITGIGQCSWDMLARVASYPARDSKEEVLHWEEQGGGPVATALVTASRFGHEGRFCGVVGDDPFGEKILCSLKDEGIDIAGLVVRRGAVSQAAFIVVEEQSGKRTIYWKRTTGTALQPHELPAGYLDGARFLLLDGLMAEVSCHAAREAKSRGIPVMLDAGKMRPGMLEIARNCDYLVAAEQFAHDLGWSGDLRRFTAEAPQLGAAVVTVTLGEEGSVTWHRGEIISTPAFKVDAVDTTGAGDVFHGAYACGVLWGWPLRDTLSFASAAAALKCREMGGRKGIPEVDEVLAFLEERAVSLAVKYRWRGE
jgi:sulfofructose kinase